jgi:hypothetical protein
MRGSVRIWLLLPLMLAHWNAQAQIYMCKDASGRTITSDRPLMDCMGRAMREYDRKGNLRRDIPAPPTPEQKREMELQTEKRKQDELAADEQKRADLAIRARFHNEAEIEMARKRAVEGVRENVRRETGVLTSLEKRRQGSQAQADSYRKKNQAVPPDLLRSLDDAETGVRQSRKVIADHEAEITAINAKHDETLKRYRIISEGAAAK